MQKTKYFNRVYHSVLFFCSKIPKDVRLNTIHYLIMKINREELRNIATKHSADIDYKYFVKIYRECTKERILF